MCWGLAAAMRISVYLWACTPGTWPERGPGWLERLEGLVADNPVGVGEIGLDNALEERNDGEQEEVFLAQMELAARYERPVTVHCRKAFGRLADLVGEMQRRPPFMMLHAYAGSHEMVPVFEKLGFHISICASITRTANRKARTACVRVSPERLLVESDSPAIARSEWILNATNLLTCPWWLRCWRSCGGRGRRRWRRGRLPMRGSFSVL